MKPPKVSGRALAEHLSRVTAAHAEAHQSTAVVVEGQVAQMIDNRALSTWEPDHADDDTETEDGEDAGGDSVPGMQPGG